MKSAVFLRFVLCVVVAASSGMMLNGVTWAQSKTDSRLCAGGSVEHGGARES